MRQNLQPVRGRQLLVERLEGTWDFQAWFRKLHGQISGLAATHLEPDVNHVWRFASYGKLQNIMPESKLQVMRNDWADMEPDDKDVVLLLKESTHLQGFRQEPVLLLPHKVAALLAKGGSEACAAQQVWRNDFERIPKDSDCSCSTALETYGSASIP